MPEYCHLKTETFFNKRGTEGKEGESKGRRMKRDVLTVDPHRSLFLLLFVTGHLQDTDLAAAPLEQLTQNRAYAKLSTANSFQASG